MTAMTSNRLIYREQTKIDFESGFAFVYKFTKIISELKIFIINEIFFPDYCFDNDVHCDCYSISNSR